MGTSFDIAASLEAAGRQQAEGCVKIWEDLDRYQSALSKARPDLIIECGTFTGHSALWLQRAAGCDVVTIDNRFPSAVTDETRRSWERVVSIVGDTVDTAVVAAVGRLASTYDRVMAVLDSDHSAAHVLSELHAYAPLVSVGCYCVVEDGIVRWMADQPYVGSPLDAIEAWLSDHPDWEVDIGIDSMYPVSMYPSGWLWRRR